MKDPESYFVTGTDTGVGKTLISCALLHAFAAKGKRVAGMKPVACGCNELGQYEDVEQLFASGNLGARYDQINPYNFIAPLAPSIAARHAGIRIELEPILDAFRYLSTQADVVIVEGVGGYRTPLNEWQDGADLAVKLDLPVVMVVGMRLGCLNHALLTVAAIKASGLEMAGWVANVLDAGMPELRANILELENRVEVPLLGVTEFQRQPDAKTTAGKLNIELLNSAEGL